MDVFDLSAKLTLDKSQYDSGITEAKTSGSGLGSALVTAGKVAGAGIATVGTAVAGLATGLTKATSDLASYGDNIDKSSQKMGISAEFYQTWDAVLQHSGTSMSAMTSTFKTLANVSSDATNEQAEALAKLGLTTEDLGGSAETAFTTIITKLQGMEEGTERSAIAQDLLGKGAVELGALFNTSAEDTQGMIDTVKELGGVLSDDAVKSSAQFEDNLQDLQTALSGAKNNMLSEFLPAINSVLQGLTSVFSGDDGGVGKINEGITSFVNKLTEALPKITEFGASILETLGEAIIENLPQIIDTGAQVVLELAGALINNLPQIVETGLQVIVALAKGIGEQLPELIPTIVDVVLEIVDTLIDNVDLLIDGAIAIIVGLANGLIESLPKLIEKAPEIILKLTDALIDNTPTLIEASIEIIVTLAKALMDNLPTLIAKVPEIVTALLKKFLSLTDTLVEIGNKYVAKIKDTIATKWQDIVGSVSEWVGKMVDKFLSFTSKLKEMGKTLIENAKEGIVNSWNGVVTGVSDWVTKMVDKFLSFTSKLKEMGKTLIENAKEGIVNSWNGVVTGVSELVQRFYDGFTAFGSKIKEIGTNIVEGIKQGILDAWDSFKEWVIDKFRGIIDDVKGVFGIASPSKVFKQIGEYCIEGLQEGSEELFSTKGLKATVSADVTSSIGNPMDAVVNILQEYLPYVATNDGMRNLSLKINKREFARLVNGV